MTGESATTASPARTVSPSKDLVFPPGDLSGLVDLARFVEGRAGPTLLRGADGEEVSLPAEVYHALRQVVEVMRQGKATLVAPQGLLLTTQEAADFLGVSRPTRVKILESGTVPFEKPNRHRRVRLQDLMTFQHRRLTERQAALDTMTEDATELGLYTDTQADYDTALRSARRRRSTPRPKE